MHVALPPWIMAAATVISIVVIEITSPSSFSLSSFPLKKGSASVGSDRKDSQELTGHDKAPQEVSGLCLSREAFRGHMIKEGQFLGRIW